MEPIYRVKHSKLFGPPRFIHGPIVSNAGEPLDDGPYKSPREIKAGMDITQAPKGILRANPRIPLGDCLEYDARGNFLVKRSIHRLFEAAGIVLDPTTFLWPVDVISSTSSTLREEYVALWATREIAVLSDSGDYVYYETSRAVQRVKRYALSAEIPPYDLLMDRITSRWFARERFIRFIHDNKLTGFQVDQIREGDEEPAWPPSAR